NSSKPYLGNSNPVATLAQSYDELLADREALKAAYQELKNDNSKLEDELSSLAAQLKDDDGDGVANMYDKCPNTPQGVKVDGSGGPVRDRKHETKVIEQIVVAEEDRKVVAEAISDLAFDLSKATIRPSSYESLNRVAALLIEKNFSLKLAGHTDNTFFFSSRRRHTRFSRDWSSDVCSSD